MDVSTGASVGLYSWYQKVKTKDLGVRRQDWLQHLREEARKRCQVNASASNLLHSQITSPYTNEEKRINIEQEDSKDTIDLIDKKSATLPLSTVSQYRNSISSKLNREENANENGNVRGIYTECELEVGRVVVERKPEVTNPSPVVTPQREPTTPFSMFLNRSFPIPTLVMPEGNNGALDDSRSSSLYSPTVPVSEIFSPGTRCNTTSEVMGSLGSNLDDSVVSWSSALATPATALPPNPGHYTHTSPSTIERLTLHPRQGLRQTVLARTLFSPHTPGVYNSSDSAGDKSPGLGIIRCHSPVPGFSGKAVTKTFERRSSLERESGVMCLQNGTQGFKMDLGGTNKDSTDDGHIDEAITLGNVDDNMKEGKLENMSFIDNKLHSPDIRVTVLPASTSTPVSVQTRTSLPIRHLAFHSRFLDSLSKTRVVEESGKEDERHELHPSTCIRETEPGKSDIKENSDSCVIRRETQNSSTLFDDPLDLICSPVFMTRKHDIDRGKSHQPEQDLNDKEPRTMESTEDFTSMTVSSDIEFPKFENVSDAKNFNDGGVKCDLCGNCLPAINTQHEVLQIIPLKKGHHVGNIQKFSNENNKSDTNLTKEKYCQCSKNRTSLFKRQEGTNLQSPVVCKSQEHHKRKASNVLDKLSLRKKKRLSGKFLYPTSTKGVYEKLNVKYTETLCENDESNKIIETRSNISSPCTSLFKTDMTSSTTGFQTLARRQGNFLSLSNLKKDTWFSERSNSKSTALQNEEKENQEVPISPRSSHSERKHTLLSIKKCVAKTNTLIESKENKSYEGFDNITKCGEGDGEKSETLVTPKLMLQKKQRFNSSVNSKKDTVVVPDSQLVPQQDLGAEGGSSSLEQPATSKKFSRGQMQKQGYSQLMNDSFSDIDFSGIDIADMTDIGENISDSQSAGESISIQNDNTDLDDVGDAREVLHDKEFSQNCVARESGFIGFVTGNGKKMSISKKALLHAKKLLEEPSDEVETIQTEVRMKSVEHCKDTSTIGAQGNLLTNRITEPQISQSSQSRTGEDSTISTGKDAGGKMKFTLKRPGKLSSEENLSTVLHDPSKPCPFESVNTVFRKDKSDNQCNIPDSTVFQGFKTGLGAPVQISESSLQRARKFWQETESPHTSEERDKRGHAKETRQAADHLDSRRVPSICESSAKSKADGFPGFATASGVRSSKEALQKAQVLWEDDALDLCSEGKPSTTRNTIRKKTIQQNLISEKSLLVHEQRSPNSSKPLSSMSSAPNVCRMNTKERMNTDPFPNERDAMTMQKDDTLGNTSVQSTPSHIGFCTAGGNKVAVNESAIQRAKKLWEESSNSDCVVKNKTAYTERCISTKSRTKSLEDKNTPKIKSMVEAHKDSVDIEQNSLQISFTRSEHEYLDHHTANSLPLISGGIKTSEVKEMELANKSSQMCLKEEFQKNGSVTHPSKSGGINSVEESVGFPFFSTARGKRVRVNKDAVIKAKRFLSEDVPAEDIMQNCDRKNYNTKHDLLERYKYVSTVSEALINCSDENQISKSDKMSDKVSVGDASKLSRKILPQGDTSQSSSTLSNSSSKSLTSKIKPEEVHGKTSTVNHGETTRVSLFASGFEGFSTARGGKVILKGEASLIKARKLFEDISDQDQTCTDRNTLQASFAENYENDKNSERGMANIDRASFSPKSERTSTPHRNMNSSTIISIDKSYHNEQLEKRDQYVISVKESLCCRKSVSSPLLTKNMTDNSMESEGENQKEGNRVVALELEGKYIHNDISCVKGSVDISNDVSERVCLGNPGFSGFFSGRGKQIKKVTSKALQHAKELLKETDNDDEFIGVIANSETLSTKEVLLDQCGNSTLTDNLKSAEKVDGCLGDADVENYNDVPRCPSPVLGSQMKKEKKNIFQSRMPNCPSITPTTTQPDSASNISLAHKDGNLLNNEESHNRKLNIYGAVDNLFNKMQSPQYDRVQLLKEDRSQSPDYISQLPRQGESPLTKENIQPQSQETIQASQQVRSPVLSKGHSTLEMNHFLGSRSIRDCRSRSSPTSCIQEISDISEITEAFLKDDLWDQEEVKAKTATNRRKRLQDSAQEDDDEEVEGSEVLLTFLKKQRTDAIPACSEEVMQGMSEIATSRELLKMKQSKVIQYKDKQKHLVQPVEGVLHKMRQENKSERVKLQSLGKLKVLQGVRKDVYSVQPSTALQYRFPVEDSRCEVMRCSDGCTIVPGADGNIGVEEVERGFLAAPGVHPRLLHPTWVHNHYKWIVWYLAALERSLFNCSVLTLENVVLRLKYRYDREIDRAQRPILRKVTEQDDIPQKTMVLCVASIRSVGSGVRGEGSASGPGGHTTLLELTDGWYSIGGVVDRAMTGLVECGKVVVGTKLVIHGAELTGPLHPCHPLETPDSLRLRLHTNLTRRACWWARLGLLPQRGPLPTLLAAIKDDGGLAGQMTVLLARVYPTIYFERAGGKVIFRGEKAHRRMLRETQKQKEFTVNQIVADVEKEFSQQAKEGKGRKGRIATTKEEICSLTMGQDIARLLEETLDPSNLEGLLTANQIQLARTWQERQAEERRRKMNTEVQHRLGKKQALYEATPLLKVRIVDRDGSNAIITIWRPTEDLQQALSEGNFYSIQYLMAGGYRRGCQQFTATRQTKWEHIAPSFTYECSRFATPLCLMSSAQLRPLWQEVDVAGVVLSVEQPDSVVPVIAHIVDHHINILKLKIWEGLKESGYEDIFVVGSVISVMNGSWRGHAGGRFGCVHITELTTISAVPRGSHLIEAITHLKHSIQDMKRVLHEGDMKLDRQLDSRVYSVTSVAVVQEKVIGKQNEKCSDKVQPECTEIETVNSEMDTLKSNSRSPGNSESKKVSNYTKCRMEQRSQEVRSKLHALAQYGTPSPLRNLQSSATLGSRKPFRAPFKQQ